MWNSSSVDKMEVKIYNSTNLRMNKNNNGSYENIVNFLRSFLNFLAYISNPTIRADLYRRVSFRTGFT